MQQNAVTYRAYKVKTPNSELPVTLEAARDQLRAEDQRFDDGYIRRLIYRAAAHIEKQYGLALLTQTIEEFHQGFPCSPDTPLLLRISPLISVVSIYYVDAAGDTQPWESSEYAWGHYNQSAFIVPKTNYTWPVANPHLPNGVIITYTAGFGTKASAVPENIQDAILLMIAKSYMNREDSPATLPQASEALLFPYYRFSC